MGHAVLLLAALAAAAAALPAPAVVLPPVAATVGSAAVLDGARSDSLAALARARDAQADFERLRVRHLPRVLGSGGSDCDDVVGRMCWRHGPGRALPSEPEDERTSAGRRALLDTLAAVADEIPGDAWVLGQRVWYLGEAGRWSEARAVARRCGVPRPGWCRALEGFVLHRTGRIVEAEEAFAAALEAMGPDVRGRWRDPTLLLDGEGREALARARAAGTAEAFVERVWSLSDPLWSVEGNDRLTAHLARHTVARIRSDARNPHGLRWGEDLEELLLRYGWAVAWERSLGSALDPGSVGRVTGREDPHGRTYVPTGRILADPVGSPASAWVPGTSYAPSLYAPAHAPTFLPAPAQVVTVALGDSAVVVASVALPADTSRRGRARAEGRDVDDLRKGDAALRDRLAGLHVREIGGGRVAGARASLAPGPEGDTARLTVTVPPGRYVVSAEILDGPAGVAGRHRVGVDVPAVPIDVPELSELLVVRGGEEPTDLAVAARRLPPRPAFRSGDTLRVTWAVTGLGFRDELLAYRLTLRRRDRGILRRLGEVVGLVDTPDARRIGWDEPSGEGTAPRLRSVALDLREVEAGPWVVRLELAIPGRTVLVQERAVEVLPRKEADPSSSGRR